MTTRQKLDSIAKKSILLLDGAMGTMVQKYNLTEEDFRGTRFTSQKKKLLGCADILCLSKPDIIREVHNAYLEAGADIIEACSFNANAVALSDYDLSGCAYEISKAAAAIAKDAIQKYSSDEKPRFVAGILGPLTKSASISPDMNDAGARSVTFDEIEGAYYDNARGLLDGGADILMLETIFDTLNAKAGIAAVLRIGNERGIDIPLMISAAISDSAGRLLAGQTVEAFCISVMHAIRENNTGLFSVGLNCSLGAELLKPYIKTLSRIAPCMVSAHPNAGLPNALGEYDETPDEMARLIGEYIDGGLVNIVGGCCGSTPEHIRAIAKVLKNKNPRKLPVATSRFYLCGLEPACIDRDKKLFICGEKGNAAGNKKFLQFIKDGNFSAALKMVRDNIAEGIDAVDISMDDALVDGPTMMVKFLQLALSDPAIARAPFVIDSSDFTVIEAALKCIQGRVIANSISLKDGEAEFLRKARRIRDLGAVPMVMLFDEKGQAALETDKINIAKRAYNLLINNNFPANEIFIDPNVLSVATGIEEHDSYANNFINACKTISEECPGVKISAGVSNLSYSFRGNSTVRNAMHAVFLKLCFDAGLSMAIVNTASLNLYDAVDGELKTAIEDVLLYRDKEASARLLELAKKTTATIKSTAGRRGRKQKKLDTGERVVEALISGIDDEIENDVALLLEKLAPLEIIEGPLMEGMREVSIRFSSGDMFLPEVIRSARVMKKAVAVLESVMKNFESAARQKEKIVLATVKGDVHDIGKNIVATVLGCNGFEIIDLGVMVSAEKIIETAVGEKAAFIGLSGLVTPSLFEMCAIAELCEKNKLSIPLLVGGATTSLVHTALRIAPLYSAPVVYVRDAGAAPEAALSLLSPALRDKYIAALQKKYDAEIEHHNKIEAERELISIEDAGKNKVSVNWAAYKKRISGIKKSVIDSGALPLEKTEYTFDYDIEKVIPYIDWRSFTKKLDVDKGTASAKKLIGDAQKMLKLIKKEKLLTLCGAVRFYPALSSNEDIILLCKNERGKKQASCGRLSFLRSQRKKQNFISNPSLADFILPLEEAAEGECDYIGFFVLSAGVGVESAKKKFLAANDNYGAILIATLADTLVEAFSEKIHRRVEEAWRSGEKTGSSNDKKIKVRGIRPAFGYPSASDHADKRLIFKLLDIKNHLPLRLTGSAMINPAASVCGMYFLNPASFYFATGKIGDDQLAAWAKRKKINMEEARKRTGNL
jgi:5-methyltetrahydrofolate--homocysteine methyltransferase